jgi:hypothetical protein
MFISKLERGVTTPTIGTLLRHGNALKGGDVDLVEVFAEAGASRRRRGRSSGGAGPTPPPTQVAGRGYRLPRSRIVLYAATTTPASHKPICGTHIRIFYQS